MAGTLYKHGSTKTAGDTGQVPAPKAKSAKEKKRKSARRRLYHGGKISDAMFKKVLWHFVRDDSASDTARAIGLSINSVHAIYRKVRVYFYEVGLFMDFYAGQDPLEYESDNPHFEKALLEFHFERVRARNGLKSPASEPPYHFAESCWRYDFKVIAEERSSPYVHDMMLAHLLEIILVCGPVGAIRRPSLSSALVVERQYYQRVLWLLRSTVEYSLNKELTKLPT